jgi:hypothetical protein
MSTQWGLSIEPSESSDSLPSLSTPSTWRALRAALPTGLPDAALEIVRRVGARDRHQERVNFAHAVAAAVAETDAYWEAEEAAEGEDLAIAFLAIVEENGHGGPMGLGGKDGASRRMPPFDTCGTGRKNSGSGAAWSATIRELATPLYSGTVGLGMSDDGMFQITKTSAGLSPDGQGGYVPTVTRIEIDPEAIGAPWRVALGRRAVLLLTGHLPEWCSKDGEGETTIGCRINWMIQEGGSDLQAWGGVLQAAEDELAAERAAAAAEVARLEAADRQRAAGWDADLSQAVL